MLIATGISSLKKGKTALQLTIIGLLMAFGLEAQVYTTKADGNWTSPSTWVGGSVPSRTISSSMVVNINHDVTCNVTGDLTISGTLNIVGDTLRFASSFDKKTIINSSGLLKIVKGGYLQDVPANKCEMSVNGGRIILDSAKLTVSKDFKATAGTSRNYMHSNIQVGGRYEASGTLLSYVNDSVQSSTIEVSKSSGGDLELKSFTRFKVSNAIINVNDGKFKQDALSEILTLPGSSVDYGFDVLKISKELEVNGTWDAKIDAYCIAGGIKGLTMLLIDFTRDEDCSLTYVNSGPAPELIFLNPVLKSGQANKQGAVYRFSNVLSGVDAEIKLAKFSRSDIVMQSIDLPDLGWEKAFQPQFGLAGVVQPNQNWYIDFELSFYQAGTNTKKKLAKVDLTALDVDGDGWSINEYANFEAPSNIIYSTISFLTSLPSGLPGQLFTCALDGVSSLLTACASCGGDGKSGLWNISTCGNCDGSGLIYDQCDHGFEGVNSTTLTGPVENFLNIDTAATQVMATYQYLGRDKIKFRYGARSGSRSSNGSGVRLNSLWFRQFGMAAALSLPVKILDFTATYRNDDVSLVWTSEMEENFSHFIVQRSSDGKTYSDIATVNSAGRTIRTRYEYKDLHVSSASGICYYRIVCVDKTGEVAYTTIRTVRLSKDNLKAITLTTYPNPVVDQVKVTLPASWQGKKVLLELYNASGFRINASQISSASQTESIQMSKVSKGLYIIKARCEEEFAQERIIKN